MEISEYVQGYTSEAVYCPFCAKVISIHNADGSQICDECDTRFYVIESEGE